MQIWFAIRPMDLQVTPIYDSAIAIIAITWEMDMSDILKESGVASRRRAAAHTLGVMYLTHSIVLKVFTFGFAGTAGYFASLGLPPATAYLVIAAEVIGGVLLLANVATGWVALALLPVLGGALWVHSGNGWVFSANGGGWEYPLFLIVVSVAVALQAFAARERAANRTPVDLGRSSVRRKNSGMSNAGLFATVAREYANFQARLSTGTVRVARARCVAARMPSGIAVAAVARRARRSPSTSPMVHATDVAPEQIAAARPHPASALLGSARRTLRAWPSVRGSGHRRTGAALVRCRGVLRRGARVARPGALLVVWNYPRPKFVDAELDAAIPRRSTRDVVGPYWPPGAPRTSKPAIARCHFPLERVATPAFRSRTRLESRAGHRLCEQLVGNRALSAGAGHRPGAAAARVARRPFGAARGATAELRPAHACSACARADRPSSARVVRSVL